eukprot:TRINITY_DN83234_c0_g1_i1.p1 TRINITY_DN83234_c0_g1~~TRINITY_DN83234_c0_g1_i1.p1  ORF type:complete len:203 (+),score=13.65 TRINITY_DN83234_c0_g1_i1:687-1295(+)
MRLVAWQRNRYSGMWYRSRAELASSRSSSCEVLSGDILYLASADRAAFLEVATLDRLPLSAALMNAEDLAELEAPLNGLGSELSDALEFAEQQSKVSQQEARQMRLARLATFPIVRQVLFMAQQDAVWSKLLPVFARRAEDAYEAAESQLPAYWSAPTRVDPPVSGWQVFLLVILAIGFLFTAAYLTFSQATLPEPFDAPLA